MPPDEGSSDRAAPAPESPQARLSDPEAILVVDDNDEVRCVLQRTLARAEGRRVTTVGSAAEARRQLEDASFDVVITDLRMPDEDGLSLMTWAQEHCPGPSWIVLTGHGTMEAAVKALQLGAFDFIAKPLQGTAPLRNAVQNAIENRRLLLERDRLTAELAQRNDELRSHVDQLEEACHLLEEQSETIQADLRRAALIQQALLPREAPVLEGFRVEALYRPSESVGGDLYDAVSLDDRHLALVIGDAAGHGLAAAMLAVLFHTRLPLRDREGRARRPQDAMRLVNQFLCEFSAPGLFLTAALCVLETATGALRVASAGHPPLLLQRAGGSIERIFHTGPALGLYPGAVFGQQELVLGRGDRLLLHTDGLYDRIHAGAGTLPADRVASRLQGDRVPGPGALGRIFAAEIPTASSEAGAGPPQEDDVTVVLLAAEPGPSEIDNGLPPRLPATLVPVQSTAELLVGCEGARTTISLRGRVGWAASAAFYDRCLQEIDAARPVVLDLSLCDHLDSTFLGTIHEVAERAEHAQVELRLQGVMPPAEALFEELGMTRVLERMVATMLPLPHQMAPLVDAGSDAHRRAVRILRAHESLAGLSEENRREFDPLLEVLRREVEAKRPQPRRVQPRSPDEANTGA